MIIKSAFAAALALGLGMGTGCSGVRPASLGIKDGRLAPCPASPNCVSSFSTDTEHAIEPLTYASSPAEAMADLAKVILGMKRTRIITATDSYLYAEFTSAIFRFVDDVEFAVNEQAKRIDLRSASRLGYSDMGVNRKRIEDIRAAWNARNKR